MIDGNDEEKKDYQSASMYMQWILIWLVVWVIVNQFVIMSKMQ